MIITTIMIIVLTLIINKKIVSDYSHRSPRARGRPWPLLYKARRWL